jgi:hypothetical protein
MGELPNALALAGISLIAGSGSAIVVLDQRPAARCARCPTRYNPHGPNRPWDFRAEFVPLPAETEAARSGP